MKHSLVACAIAAALSATFAGAVSAQSNVTMYGTVDAGFVRESGGVAGTVNKIGSGIGSVSRLGFRGSEDLGAGLSANFVLELGAKIDTGEIDTAGSIFNRQALVGLKSTTLGALTLGRQYTPYYTTLSTVADPFGTAYAGNIKNLFPTAGNNTRTSNMVLYTSPSVQGWSGELAYTMGEQAGSNTAGRQLGAAIAYSAGALNARLGYNNRNNDISAAAGAGMTPPVAASSRDIGTNTVLAANYNLGVVKSYAAYGRDKGPNSAPLPNSANPYGGVRPTASTDSSDCLLGLTAPVASGTVIASYIGKDDKSAFNQDARQWGLAYSHPLSKRTNLYGAYAKIRNKNGAGYTVGNNGEAGSGDQAINLGMRHTF
ncbi:porin [Massilia cavernae]|uniref:Porin n=1 Tax=Massilia cavernae TaxID=2320864 RepID=A0A418Y4N3_9BURK|nr:porin [Massilia cavernae]RJG20892.1 porin [Massilia cavernae]